MEPDLDLVDAFLLNVLLTGRLLLGVSLALSSSDVVAADLRPLARRLAAGSSSVSGDLCLARDLLPRLALSGVDFFEAFDPLFCGTFVEVDWDFLLEPFAGLDSLGDSIKKKHNPEKNYSSCLSSM